MEFVLISNVLDQLVEVEALLARVRGFAVLAKDVGAEAGLHSLVQQVQIFETFLVLFER